MKTRTLGTLTVLAALVWSAPAQQGPGPTSPTLVADRAVLSQGDPGIPAIPEPVAPEPAPVAQPDPAPVFQPDPAPVFQPDPLPATQPDPVPVTQPDPAAVPDPAVVTQAPVVAPDPADPAQPAPAPGPPPLFPPELATPGQPDPGVTAPAAPVVAVPDSQPTPLSPVDPPAPFAPVDQPAPLIQDPAQSGGCPYNAGAGALLPPSVWSVCPGQAPGLAYSPFTSLSDSSLSEVPGAQQIQIPWVTGFPTNDAQSILSQSGLNIGSVTQESSGSAEGTVLRTDPPFGSAVEPGRAINLVVAGP